MSDPSDPIGPLVYVGFNANVLALDSATGRIVWTWRSPASSGRYVTLRLLNPQQLIVAVDGFIFCLDPSTGDERWSNPTTGFGYGVTSIVAHGAPEPDDVLVATAAEVAAREAAAKGTDD
ncbi:MAG: PQQ-binding-like beta-propeller repeat protein [Anaerolineae bacterium]